MFLNHYFIWFLQSLWRRCGLHSCIEFSDEGTEDQRVSIHFQRPTVNKPLHQGWNPVLPDPTVHVIRTIHARGGTVNICWDSSRVLLSSNPLPCDGFASQSSAFLPFGRFQSLPGCPICLPSTHQSQDPNQLLKKKNKQKNRFKRNVRCHCCYCHESTYNTFRFVKVTNNRLLFLPSTFSFVSNLSITVLTFTKEG